MHDIVPSMGFQISLLLLVALTGYMIAAITSQSAIVGQILAGIFLGPSLFNVVTYNEFVSNLAHLGAVILLFVIGLEFKLKDILQIKNAIIAFFGIVIPWCAGYATTLIFDYSNQTAIFVGTTLTATSIAITANVLKEFGKLRSDIGKIIIGSAVIDDILALIVLTISVDINLETIKFSMMAWLVFKSALFLFLAAALGQGIFVKIIQRIDESRFSRDFPEFVFIFTMAIAFSYAIAAELVGLSAIVGAFTAGAVFEGVTLKNSHSFSDGADYLRIIFASIFFTSLGILADLSQVSLSNVPFIASICVAAILSKLIGCMLPSFFMKHSLKQSFIIGVAMVPRGEIAMVVAIIGLKKGLIDQSIYVALIIMSIVTTLIVPHLLRYLFSIDKEPTSSPIPL